MNRNSHSQAFPTGRRTGRAGGALKAPGVAVLVTALALLVATALAENADELFERAQRLAELKKYASAIEVMLDFQTKFEDDKRVPEAQYLMGRYQHLRNYLNSALEEYNYVVEDFSDTVFAARSYAYMADIYVHMEELDKAVKVLEIQAKDLHETREAFHGLRKLRAVYLDMKDEDKAVGAFKRMIEYDAAELLKRTHHQERARVDRDIHRGVFFLANRAIEQKEYEAAQYAYSRLPGLWEKVQLLIELLFKQDKIAEIHDLLRDMEGDNFWKAQHMLMDFYVKRDALRGLKIMIKQLAGERKPSDNLNRLFRRLNKHDLTRRMKAEAQREIYELVAARYRPLRREFEFKICDLVAGTSPQTLQRFILTYVKGGDVEECKRWRGIFFEMQKDRKKAHEEYWLMVDKPKAHFYVAESYHGHFASMAGNRDLRGAIKEYMEIRKRFYNTRMTCEAYWRMGHLHAELREKDKAIAVLAELEKRFVGQPRWRTRARYRIAEWQRQWKRFKDAIESYRKVDRQYPKTWEQQWSVYNVGLCWEGLKEKVKAINTFIECIRRFDQTQVQATAHNRLELKYKIPDTQIRDMVKDLD